AWILACVDVRSIGVESAQVILPRRGKIDWEPMGGPANGIRARMFAAPGRLYATTACYGPDFARLLGIPAPSGANFVQRPPDAIIPAPIRGLALPWLSGYPWPRGDATDWRVIQASGWPMLALASEDRLAPRFA